MDSPFSSMKVMSVNRKVAGEILFGFKGGVQGKGLSNLSLNAVTVLL